MEICRICISLENLVLAATLSLIFLFSTQDIHQLILKVIADIDAHPQIMILKPIDAKLFIPLHYSDTTCTLLRHFCVFYGSFFLDGDTMP
jgi:hypothetical protein